MSDDINDMDYLDHLGLALEHLELAHGQFPNDNLLRALVLTEEVLDSVLDDDDELDDIDDPELRLWSAPKEMNQDEGMNNDADR